MTASTISASRQSMVKSQPMINSGKTIALVKSGIWWATNNSTRSTSSPMIFFKSPVVRLVKKPNGSFAILRVIATRKFIQNVESGNM